MIEMHQINQQTSRQFEQNKKDKVIQIVQNYTGGDIVEQTQEGQCSSDEEEDSLTDTINNTKKGVQKGSKDQISSSSQCSIHSKKIKAYCANDKQLVCIDCILCESHKNHEIISQQKAKQQCEEDLQQQYQKAKDLEIRVNNQYLSIETHLNSLSNKANENRQQITQLFTHFRKILQEREIDLKKKISQTLEQEEITYKEAIKKVKAQLRNILKFTQDYEKFVNQGEGEEEIEFLNKYKLRCQRADKALIEIDEIALIQPFQEVKFDSETKKVCKLFQKDKLISKQQCLNNISSTNQGKETSSKSNTLIINYTGNKVLQTNQQQHGIFQKAKNVILGGGIQSTYNNTGKINKNSISSTQGGCGSSIVATARNQSRDRKDGLNLLKKFQSEIGGGGIGVNCQQTNTGGIGSIQQNENSPKSFQERKSCFSQLKKVDTTQNDFMNTIAFSTQQSINPLFLSTQQMSTNSNNWGGLSLSKQGKLFQNQKDKQLTSSAQKTKNLKTFAATSNLKDIIDSTRQQVDKALNLMKDSYFTKSLNAQILQSKYSKNRKKKGASSGGLSYRASTGNHHYDSNKKKCNKQKKHQKIESLHDAISLKNKDSALRSYYNYEQSIKDQKQNNHPQRKSKNVYDIEGEDELSQNLSKNKNNMNSDEDDEGQISDDELNENKGIIVQSLYETDFNSTINEINRKPFNDLQRVIPSPSSNLKSQQQSTIKNQLHPQVQQIKTFEYAKLKNEISPSSNDYINKRGVFKQVDQPQCTNNEEQQSEIITNSMIQFDNIALRRQSQNSKNHLNQYQFKNNNNLNNQTKNNVVRSNHFDLLKPLYQSIENTLYVFSGFFDQPLNSIEYFEVDSGIWREITGQLKIPRTKFQAISVINKEQLKSNSNDMIVTQNLSSSIYIIGGKKFDGHRTDKIEVFNPKSGESQLIKQTLPKARSGFAAFNIGTKIYIIGGNDGRVLNKVDVLDIASMKWEKIPNMILKRDELAVTVGPDNKIYAVGGYGGPDNQCLNSAERFDLQKGGVWEMLPPMNEHRRALALVALPDGVYAIGGYNGKEYLSSVEKYDETKRCWVYVKSMNNARCTLSAIASAPDYQYIYAFGGFNGSPMNVVERYSVVNDYWEFITPMKRARFMHSCCIAQNVGQTTEFLLTNDNNYSQLIEDQVLNEEENKNELSTQPNNID